MIDKTTPTIPTVNLYNQKSNSLENRISLSELSKYTLEAWKNLKVYT